MGLIDRLRRVGAVSVAAPAAADKELDVITGSASSKQGPAKAEAGPGKGSTRSQPGMPTPGRGPASARSDQERPDSDEQSANISEEGERPSALQERQTPMVIQAGDRTMTNQACEQDGPLVIQADAPLVDGLRALLVHHLKQSIGSSVVNLSVSQAELLEHHLARLASYAQKIVHTLAFATRFLAKQRFESDAAGELGSTVHDEDGGAGGAAGARSLGSAGTGAFPAAADGGPVSQRQCTAQPPSATGAVVYRRIPVQQPVPEPRPTRKPLKLSDDEILDLYRSAQAEAAIEADWRGIQGPTPSRGGDGSDGGVTSRSSCSQKGASPAPEPAPTEARGKDQEYLRIFSRALQQPGRSPRAVAAELVDPSTKRELVCCEPRVEVLLDGTLNRTGVVHGGVGLGLTSAREGTAVVEADPGSVYHARV
mmetsp:Transcript_113436/g.315885  ORF Transcript_113436/g.315885 Transcript_113436/m.315885 type:complete len:425 (+) Transcript_113436:278-1552(+)